MKWNPFASLPPMSGRTPYPIERRRYESTAGELPQEWNLDRLALLYATRDDMPMPETWSVIK